MKSIIYQVCIKNNIWKGGSIGTLGISGPDGNSYNPLLKALLVNNCLSLSLSQLPLSHIHLPRPRSHSNLAFNSDLTSLPDPHSSTSPPLPTSPLSHPFRSPAIPLTRSYLPPALPPVSRRSPTSLHRSILDKTRVRPSPAPEPCARALRPSPARAHSSSPIAVNTIVLYICIDLLARVVDALGRGGILACAPCNA
jgi:hypothetical protein